MRYSSSRKPYVMTIVFLLGSKVFACGGGNEANVNATAGNGETQANVNTPTGNGGTQANVNTSTGNGGTQAKIDATAGNGGTQANACPNGHYWDVTYDLPTSQKDPGKTDADLPTSQNVLTLRDTMMGMGDGNSNIGPGTATVRFQNVDGKPRGKAYLLKFEIKVDFTVPPATTNLVGTMGHGYDKGPCGSSAVGNVEGDQLIWSDFAGTALGNGAPNVHGYFTDGTITCDGALCGQFGAPPQGTTPQTRGPFDLRFEPWKLSGDASTFLMAPSITQKDVNTTTRIQVYGVEKSRECKSIVACEP